MDEGTRKGLRLAGLIGAAGSGFLLGALRLAEGISDHATWDVLLGVALLLGGVLFAVEARRLHKGP